MEGTGRVFAAVLRNRDLRRVQLAFVCFNASEYAVWLAMLVYAYDHGGATASGLVAVLQLVPAALFAPFASALADRHRPVRVLLGGYLAQAAGMGATAAVILGAGPAPLAYACAAVAATAVTITRPTQSALLPALARTADELTASNVVSGWVENGSVLVATAATGVLLGVTGPGTVFALMAVLALVAAVLVAPVHGPPGAAAGESDSANALAEVAAGFAVLRTEPRPRLLVLLIGLELTLYGALDILFVVLALSVLHRGQGWVGYLNAAFAAGGLVGSVASSVIVGRRRLGPPIVLGMLIWGASFLVIAVFPSALAALVLLVGGGVGRALFDVSARSLLQRVTPAETLARVFGVLEGLDMAGLALGALIVPPLVALGGSTAALVGVGLLTPLAVLLSVRGLRRIDASVKVPIVEISLLRSLRIFAPLPPPAIEGLAHSLQEATVPSGAAVVTQGETGDRFYAIADGTLEVIRDGTCVAEIGRGEFFGEIALLEDVPRTATVRAVSDARLYSLDKDEFVTAVAGHAPVGELARSVVAERRQPVPPGA